VPVFDRCIEKKKAIINRKLCSCVSILLFCYKENNKQFIGVLHERAATIFGVNSPEIF